MENKQSFVARHDDDTACICIKDGGEFDGVIYKYGKVSIPDRENDDGNLPLRFEYDIVENCDIPREKFDQKFFKLIGDILVHIIDTQTPEDIDADN